MVFIVLFRIRFIWFKKSDFEAKQVKITFHVFPEFLHSENVDDPA